MFMVNCGVVLAFMEELVLTNLQCVSTRYRSPPVQRKEVQQMLRLIFLNCQLVFFIHLKLEFAKLIFSYKSKKNNNIYLEIDIS